MNDKDKDYILNTLKEHHEQIFMQYQHLKLINWVLFATIAFMIYVFIFKL